MYKPRNMRRTTNQRNAYRLMEVSSSSEYSRIRSIKMAMQRFKEWLKDSNGWQRMWFVATLLMISYSVFVFPFVETGRHNIFRYEEYSAIEKEFHREECARYMSEKFENLEVPDFSVNSDTGCYRIYREREFLPDRKPITLDSYRKEFESAHWNRFFVAMVSGLLFAALLSAIFYGFGSVVAWVLKGFRRP